MKKSKTKITFRVYDTTHTLIVIGNDLWNLANCEQVVRDEFHETAYVLEAVHLKYNGEVIIIDK